MLPVWVQNDQKAHFITHENHRSKKTTRSRGTPGAAGNGANKTRRVSSKKAGITTMSKEGMNWCLRVATSAQCSGPARRCTMELSDMLQAAVDAKKKMWETVEPGRAAVAAALRNDYLATLPALDDPAGAAAQHGALAVAGARAGGDAGLGRTAAPTLFVVKLPRLAPTGLAAHGAARSRPAGASAPSNQLLCPSAAGHGGSTLPCIKSVEKRPGSPRSAAVPADDPAGGAGGRPPRPKSARAEQAAHAKAHTETCRRFVRSNKDIRAARERYRGSIDARKKAAAPPAKLVCPAGVPQQT